MSAHAVAVVGAGSWGTALAMQLGRNGHDVTLLDHNATRAAQMQATRENSRYLPGLSFPPNLQVTADPATALRDRALVVAVVPSQVMRGVMHDLRPHLWPDAELCCASKGIEVETLMTMDEVLADVLPAWHGRFSALSGPSFAREVAQGLPTAVVVAARDHEVANRAAAAFHGGFFRVYTSDDVIGVEYGGALKNVLAIACGASDGAGLGTNARAGLITRGLNEITRLATKRGAHPLTMMGLAGMGDLVLTCTGELSRNRRVGLGLGKGQKLADILAELGQVAEGVVTARSAWMLAQKVGVDMPVTEQIYRVLYEDKPLPDALRDLFGRGRKAERG